ncbi:MAG: hypothetical protein ACPHRO_12910, partial [Nannocystaceae bacterium]
LREPLELRLATVTMILTACAGLSLLGRSEGRLPLSCTLVALAILVFNRAWILPELHEALQRVDLVSRLPVERMNQAQQWTLRYRLADGAAAVLLATALLLRESLALRSLRAIASLKGRASDAPTEPSAR